MFESFAEFLINWLMIIGACGVVAGTVYGIIQIGRMLKG
jgi:hypothetical protein